MPGLQQGAGPGLLLPAVPRLLQRRRLRHRHDGVQQVRGVSGAAGQHCVVSVIICLVCRWIHAHCEGIDGEEYQVLSFLPDSVSYVCK